MAMRPASLATPRVVRAAGGMVITSPVGDAKVTPAPGGHCVVVETSTVPWPQGVGLSLPRCLDVTHDVDLESCGSYPVCD